MIKIIGLLLALFILGGCGDTTSEDAVDSQPQKKQVVVEEPEVVDEECAWYNPFCDDNVEAITTEEGLSATLTELALNSESVDTFTVDGLDVVVGYVIEEYFPDFLGDTLRDLDFLKAENLIESSSTLVDYMVDIYDAAWEFVSAPQLRSVELRAEEVSLIESIINEIYNLIVAWLFPSDEPEAPVVIDPADMIDPAIPVNFNLVDLDLKSKVFYVASATYMTITMDDIELKGRGEIGFGIGEDFTYVVQNDGTVDIDMAGLYTVEMTYYDPNYCVAVEMLDHETQELYEAYWFLDEAVYEEASNMKLAQEKCFLRRKGYSAPVVAKDGVLEPIKDERTGHAPVTGLSKTSDIVTQLINGIDRVANVTDAKYFARKMRHGIFSIYTTNGQTDTLQATETDKVMRELLPLVASSGIGFEGLMSGAYDSTIAFQDEVNRDLNNSVTEVNNRLDELISATSQAMDRTTSANGYVGESDPTTFGDVVKFVANPDIKISSLFSNSVNADVTMTVTNPADNGRAADILLTTQITTNVVGESVIDFDKVDGGQSVNYLSGADYRLDVESFNYKRNEGLMTVQGFGWMGSTSKLNFDHYKVLATFEETPEFVLLSFSATVDGTITTAAGRNFVGQLVFDGDNTSNSQMDGVLTGVNDEPRIEGFVKTSLNYDDVEKWYTSNEGAQGSTLESIGDQSYTMEVMISKDDKKVSADVLVQRDDATDKWYYNMQDLNVSDNYGTMKASSVYFVQNGVNTLEETLDKLILSGMNFDSDINALINLGWDIANDFSEIGVEGLELLMQPQSGAVNVKASTHVKNSGSTMSADLVSSYDYATTHLSSSGDFTTTVDTSSGTNVYSNNFTTKGHIKVDNVFNYLYELEYSDAAQYVLFTRDDSAYQMGFVMRGSEIKGGDSYGVLADFTMNENYDILNTMDIKNTNSDTLGTYNKADNALQVIFSDDVKEYLYLY